MRKKDQSKCRRDFTGFKASSLFLSRPKRVHYPIKTDPCVAKDISSSFWVIFPAIPTINAGFSPPSTDIRGGRASPGKRKAFHTGSLYIRLATNNASVGMRPDHTFVENTCIYGMSTRQWSFQFKILKRHLTVAALRLLIL